MIDAHNVIVQSVEKHAAAFFRGKKTIHAYEEIATSENPLR